MTANSALNSGFQAVLAQLKSLANNQQTLLELRDALKANIEKETQLMSQITDWAAQEEADLSTISSTLDSISQGVTALDALIANFQNSPGALTPEDQAALDQIQAASKALVTKVQAISTAPPAAPGTGGTTSGS